MEEKGGLDPKDNNTNPSIPSSSPSPSSSSSTVSSRKMILQRSNKLLLSSQYLPLSFLPLTISNTDNLITGARTLSIIGREERGGKEERERERRWIQSVWEVRVVEIIWAA